ncbi:MAG: PucR family transcriptional regulator [Acidimicrobiales bacterium]
MPDLSQPERDLYLRVEQCLPALTRRILAALQTEIPLYAQLPREQLLGEITDVVVDNLRVFFRTLREGRAPTAGELAHAGQSAARRAQERIPLDAVLRAYHVGGQLGWEALQENAAPGESAVLLAASQGLLRYVQAVTTAVATAYLEEREAIYGEEREVSRSLAAALLSAQDTDVLAARLGVRVAPSYIVLAIRFEPHPDEQVEGIAAVVAARRKLRRVQASLDTLAGEPVLGLLEPEGGVALLPTSPERITATVAALPTVVSGLSRTAGAPATVGAAVGGPRELATVALEARELLSLALRLGRPPGLYLLSDLLLEYHLARESVAAPLISDMLRPIEAMPDLIRTLQCYIACNCDRRISAAKLFVHPNTLDYRLRRIAELTGLSLASVPGLQLLHTSLLLRQLRD